MRAELEVDRLLAEHGLACTCAALSMKSAWVSVGVPIRMASIFLSARISSGVLTGGAGRRRQRLGALRKGSAMAASFARDEAAMLRPVHLADAAALLSSSPDRNHVVFPS